MRNNRWWKHYENLPILLFMILSNSVHWVCFSYIVRVLCNVFVSSVASCDLIFIGVSQTIAYLNTWSSIKSILEWIADDSKVWKSHPTSLDRTRPGHPVTFTFFSHLWLDMLLKKINKKEINLKVSSVASFAFPFNSVLFHNKVKSPTSGFFLWRFKPQHLKLFLKSKIETSRAIKLTSRATWRACQVAEWVASPQVAQKSKKNKRFGIVFIWVIEPQHEVASLASDRVVDVAGWKEDSDNDEKRFFIFNAKSVWFNYCQLTKIFMAI